MKLRSAILIILLIIIADQTLKIWIKTHYPIGNVTHVLGQNWFQLYFIENAGMAWGMELGGNWGKLLLTLFRLFAVTFGSWYLVKIVREKYSRGFIICAALIYAGALGNLIDSMFYGMIFTESDWNHVAQLLPHGGGYGGFLHGKVVDMLYFPIITRGNETVFFSPIFNIADASISIGVITLLLFQKKFMHKKEVAVSTEEISNETTADPHVI